MLRTMLAQGNLGRMGALWGWSAGFILIWGGGGLPGTCGEPSNSELLAQIQAMREAYEGRISALEEENKKFMKALDDKQRVTAIERGFDKSLGKPSEVRKKYVLEKPAGQYVTEGTQVVHSTSNLTLGGYAEFIYSDRGDKTTEFDQIRTVLTLGAQLNERVKLFLEAEFEHGGTVTGRKTGVSTDGEIELEQAYIDFQFSDAVNLRAGTILVPVGRYNLYHESFANDLTDRPLVSRRISPTTWWEEGIGLHGQAFDSAALGISYEAYLFNPGRAPDISASGGFRGLRNQNNTPLYDAHKAGAFRVAFEPARSLTRFANHFELGISGYQSGFSGRRATPSSASLGGDGEVRIGSLDWTYEKEFEGHGTFGFKGEAAMAHVGPGRTFRARGQQAWGYYVEGSWAFWPGFLTKSSFGRAFKDPKLVLAARYDWTDLDIDRFDRRDMGRTTVGLSYRPLERVVYKIDYQMDHSPSRDGPGHPDSGDGSRTDAFLFSVAVGF